MTKIKCDLTGCKYNNSCCSSPCDSADNTCSLDCIELVITEDNEFTCKNLEEDYDKEVECITCQVNKYGGIKLNSYLDEINFQEHE